MIKLILVKFDYNGKEPVYSVNGKYNGYLTNIIDNYNNNLLIFNANFSWNLKNESFFISVKNKYGISSIYQQFERGRWIGSFYHNDNTWKEKIKEISI